MDWNELNEALFDSNGDSCIDLMEMLAPPFGLREEATSSVAPSHQLCSLPPAVGAFNNYGISMPHPVGNMSCSGNLSSSGESEGSSQADSSSRKRKSGFQAFFDSDAEQPKRATAAAASNMREADAEAIARVKEMVYRAAAMRPVSMEPEGAAAGGERPRRKNVRISSDPQTVAARHRRERISERLRTLQKLVPGGSKMDTASMLDEAANYLKFLKSQVTAFETLGTTAGPNPFLQPMAYDHHHHHLDFTFA